MGNRRTSTLTLDTQPPGTWESRLLFLSCPICGALLEPLERAEMLNACLVVMAGSECGWRGNTPQGPGQAHRKWSGPRCQQCCGGRHCFRACPLCNYMHVIILKKRKAIKKEHRFP